MGGGGFNLKCGNRVCGLVCSGPLPPPAAGLGGWGCWVRLGYWVDPILGGNIRQ